MNNSDAIFGGNGKYRYSLWRIWDNDKPLILFIGLNPSTADEKSDDKTITKLTKYAKKWGMGGFYIGNLFSFITSKPKILKDELKTEPFLINIIGEDNDKHLREMAAKCDKIICMWGNTGALKGRSDTICRLFPKKYCLNTNANGQPTHPLYQPLDLELREYVHYT